VLGREPGQRLGGIEVGSNAGVVVARQPQQVRVEQPARPVGPAEVVAVEPVEGGLDIVFGPGQFGGVLAHQVVQPVPVGPARLHEVHVDEQVEIASRGRGRRVGEGRRGRDGEVGAGHQPDEAEEALPGRGEGAVGQVEGRPDGEVGVVVDVQGVEPVAVAHERDVVGERSFGTRGEAGRGHPQRQRQVAARRRQVGGRTRFGPGARRAQHRREHLDRVGRRHRPHREFGAGATGHQAGQPVAAGDHHGAAAGAGQQGTHLGGVRGVVEHHEHPPPGQHRPVQRRRLVGVAGHPVRRYTHRPQEPGQQAVRIGRR
jgi:hypothetical protein